MIIDARQMKKILVANGYEYKRCKGSHFMYSNGTNTVAVNNHLNRMVAQRIIAVSPAGGRCLERGT